MDLVHLVGQGFVQHPQGENVPLGELVQVGEQPGGGQAPVAGNHAVGAFAAHGQGGPFDVAHRHLQHLFAGAVVNGQGDIDAGNLHIEGDFHTIRQAFFEGCTFRALPRFGHGDFRGGGLICNGLGLASPIGDEGDLLPRHAGLCQNVGHGRFCRFLCGAIPAPHIIAGGCIQLVARQGFKFR